MNYTAKASVEFRECLTPVNSPSKNQYGEWQTESTFIKAFSYYNLVSQLEKFYAAIPAGDFDVEYVKVNESSEFSEIALGRLQDDIYKFNDRRN